jgi:UDP:flavonoid glycosyltransferase YjiC (YdhE family)
MKAKKVLLTSIGTRGDIEPFLAVGELLKNNGYSVCYSFPTQFADLIPKSETHYPLSPAFIELLESRQGRTVMGKSSVWEKLSALRYLFKEGQKVNKLLVKEQFNAIQSEHPDAIIHNSKCSYPFLWSLHTKKPSILMSPVPYFLHSVKRHAHIGFDRDFGPLINKLTYSLANYGLAKTIFNAQTSLSQNAAYSTSRILKSLLSKKIIYSISPSLFSRPTSWPNHAQVLGHHTRSTIADSAPTQAIEDFLMQHTKVVLLTFGSMVNTNPTRISTCLFEALDALNIPTIVNTAAGGLIKLEAYANNRNFVFADTLPYDWVMKKVYATIHHGGSGTTHKALKYGCPTLIIPHILDQFGWNDLIYAKGLGPKGIPIKKLPSDSVKELIHDLYHNTRYKENASLVSKQMGSEQLEEELVNFIEN